MLSGLWAFWTTIILPAVTAFFFFYDGFLALAVTKANHSLRNRCIVGEVFRTAAF